MSSTGFAAEAPEYRDRGFWPRPIRPGTKGCFIKGWPRPDPEISPEELIGWCTKFPYAGIGLLMGSPMPDGTAGPQAGSASRGLSRSQA